MKTLGLLGGMSWESTVPYYQAVNERVRQRLGGLHSARLVLYSVDFAEVEALQQAGDWDESGRVLAEAAQALHNAGAEALVICTNTMHKVAPQLPPRVDQPILHIAGAAAATGWPCSVPASRCNRISIASAGWRSGWACSRLRRRRARHCIASSMN